MKTLKKYLIQIGLVIIVIGFLYDMFFAGIPYQDPTEKMIVQYNRNAAIALVLMQIGFVITIIGIIFKLFNKREVNQY